MCKTFQNRNNKKGMLRFWTHGVGRSVDHGLAQAATVAEKAVEIHRVDKTDIVLFFFDRLDNHAKFITGTKTNKNQNQIQIQIQRESENKHKIVWGMKRNKMKNKNQMQILTSKMSSPDSFTLCGNRGDSITDGQLAFAWVRGRGSWVDEIRVIEGGFGFHTDGAQSGWSCYTHKYIDKLESKDTRNYT